MTGSGTLLDPYIIWDVNDLQDVRLDPEAYYELGTDIDASATVGWNLGLGFEPLEWPYPLYIRRPTGDHSKAGTWTLNPAAPATLWDKVDEPPPPDDDASYIRGDANNSWALFTFNALNIPAGATILEVAIHYRQKNPGVGTSGDNGQLRVNGTTYNSLAPHSSGANPNWRYGPHWMFLNNPDTGLPWTVDDINGVGPNPLQAFGVIVTDAAPDVYYTQIFIRVYYYMPNAFTFDGKEYTISGLVVNRPTKWRTQVDVVGLFEHVNGGTVRNLTLDNASIAGEWETGGLCGEVWTGATFDNCHVLNSAISSVNRYTGGIVGQSYSYHPGTRVTVSGCSFSGTVTCDDSSGGIVGYAFETDITDCYSSGIITSNYNVGGIVGFLRDGNLTGCYSSAVVSAVVNFAGGLAGYILNSGGYITSRCFATGDVTGEDYIGGLVGYNENDSDRVFATGDVSGVNYVGGLFGSNGGLSSNEYACGEVNGDTYVGGLIGENWENVENVYSTGLLSGLLSSDVGGLIGGNSALVTDSFWDTETSGTLISDGGTGQTTAQMKDSATFIGAGWGFGTIWGMTPPCNDGYPCLLNVTSGCLWAPVVIPTVTTDPATDLLQQSATINGTLDDDGGEACDCGFEWGETIAYGNTTPTQSKTTGQTFSQPIIGLAPGTTYHFRAFATNSAGTGYGADRTFTTTGIVPTPELFIINKAYALSRYEL